jgi:signal transduction histidine kinase
MHSITARFAFLVVAFAILFSGLVVYWTWQSTDEQLRAITAREAELALQFDLAIRDYMGHEVRPLLEARLGRDQFIPEAMSTSFASRSIFERINRQFPDHLLRFSAESPRNPKNQAGPEEMRLIEFFRQHPDESRWTGELAIGGRRYYVHAKPMRMEESCRRCHGDPKDAPRELVARYGPTAGFGRPVGQIAAMDMVGIPLEEVRSGMARELSANLAAASVFLAILLGAVLLVFRYVVATRLAALADHFQRSAEQPLISPMDARLTQSDDEIGMLARSFNVLAGRLQVLHASLEERVAERTAALEAEVAQHKRTAEALQNEQRGLRQLLDVYEKHRTLVAYEIHDSVIQPLVGAQMTLEGCLPSLPGDVPEAVRKRFKGVADQLRAGIAETRRVMSGLRPTILDEQGIVVALESLLAESVPADGPAIDYQCNVTFERLAPPLETAVYRIVQEGVTNALRHSNSPRLRVAFLQEGDRLRIEIEDWGDGFQPDGIGADCFGLQGMRQRATALSGTALIDSRLGQGTRIVVELPVIRG